MQVGRSFDQMNILNRILYVLTMFCKVVLVLIYGCGYHVEKIIVWAASPVWRFLCGGWFRWVCSVGEWVMAAGVKLGHGTVRFGTIVAKSFVHDFSWWAPCIGLVCFVAIFVVSNFFSIALEVTINDNVVGYVSSEEEYQAILSQVEADIQVQLDQNATTETLSQNNAPISKEESDQNQNVTVNATQSDKEEDAPTVSSLHLEGESYAMTTTATYSLSVVRKTDLATEEELYSDVYAAVSELVGTNYGLYINDELKAASESKELLEKMLTEIKAPYEQDEKNTRIEFVEDVVIKKGMFSADQIKDEAGLRALFETDSENPAYYVCEEGDYMSTIAAKFDMTTDQLKALNPDVKETEIYEGRRINIAAPDIYLRVKTVKTETYTAKIDYKTKREPNSEMYSGTTKVKTAGKNGLKKITAEITYVDGKRTSKNIIETEVLEEPVDKVIYYGTKKRYSYSGGGYNGGDFVQGSGAASGNFRNPLPGAYISCGWYGYAGHRAVDLCLRGGTLNAAIYAADGGTVEFAGRSGGYGNLVRIRHNNGFVTCYAHLNSYNVKVGDKVSKGQMIGRAGSTGNSTGPHLHFEIRYNGTAVNPMNYISL